MRDLVPFVQFKKREKHPWNFTKINTPPSVFFTFFKFYKWYQIAQRTTYEGNCRTPFIVFLVISYVKAGSLRH